MELYQHIHWYITKKCNLDCAYCFAQRFPPGTESPENLETLAKILAQNEVKHVTLTGGEPTLVKNLDAILRILKETDIYLSLHTNGTTLTRNRIRELKGLVDDIALPIDSTGGKTQKKLKRINHLDKFWELVGEIQKQNMGLVYHTVATAINLDHLPSIYQQIKNTNFLYWRIYEFNYIFARERLLRPEPVSVDEYIKRDRNIKRFTGPCTFKKGGVDSLLARFLLFEHQNDFKDSRVQFIAARDIKSPYAFLDNSGDIQFCTWFSETRRKIGNLLEENFPEVINKLAQADEQGPFFSEEEFIEAEQDRPFFARLWDGFFGSEEAESIDPKYEDQIQLLSKIYEARRDKQFNSLNFNLTPQPSLPSRD